MGKQEKERKDDLRRKPGSDLGGLFLSKLFDHGFQIVMIFPFVLVVAFPHSVTTYVVGLTKQRATPSALMDVTHSDVGTKEELLKTFTDPHLNQSCSRHGGEVHPAQ